jgi:hypothetical protein
MLRLGIGAAGHVEATGELNVYGLPNWIGGWVSYPVPVKLVAMLGGIKVGWAMAEARVEGHPDRRSFSLTFDRPVEPGAVRSGLLEVRPVVGEVLGRPLPPWSTLRGVDALLASFANISSWRRRLGPEFPGIVQNLLNGYPSLVDRTILQPLRPADWPVSGDLEIEPSPMLFPPGLVSIPGDAVLGHRGFVFLTGGANNVLSQYTLPTVGDAHYATAQSWCALFGRRRGAAAARGITYVQTIIPEKISALPELFPGKIETPTAALHTLEAAVRADSEAAAGYVSGLELLRSDPAPQALFRAVDSHLTPEGAFKMAFALRRRIATCAPSSPVFDVPRTMAADLGNRFFDKAALDLVYETRDPDVLGPVAPTLLEQVRPTPGTFLGWREVWTCPGATVRKTLVIFGNSFCQFADLGQSCMSFWFARWFEKYHFIWSPAIDWAYAEAQGADIVIGQTIERFLDQVPID